MCPTSESRNSERKRLEANITGYSGYEDKIERSKTDRLLRQHLTHDLGTLLSQLDSPPTLFDSELKKEVSRSLSSVRRKLMMLSQSLESPIEASDSFLNHEQLPSLFLQSLYKRELLMLNAVATLSMEIRSMPQQTQKEQFEEQFAHIQDVIDTCNQGLFEREALIAEDTI